MKKQFSSQELFEIRNAIPVDMLIRDQLQMPSKISEGVFRFLCPICSEFNTAVNPATNLARCFCCLKNFNTIDLVIEVKKWGFKKSVLFLKTVLKKVSCHETNNILQHTAAAHGGPLSPGSHSYTTSSCDMDRGLETVRQIFERMFLNEQNKS